MTFVPTRSSDWSEVRPLESGSTLATSVLERSSDGSPRQALERLDVRDFRPGEVERTENRQLGEKAIGFR